MECQLSPLHRRSPHRFTRNLRLLVHPGLRLIAQALGGAEDLAGRAEELANQT